MNDFIRSDVFTLLSSLGELRCVFNRISGKIEYESNFKRSALTEYLDSESSDIEYRVRKVSIDGSDYIAFYSKEVIKNLPSVLKDMVEMLSDSVLVIDNEFNILGCNSAFREFSSETELLGKNFFSCLSFFDSDMKTVLTRNNYREFIDGKTILNMKGKFLTMSIADLGMRNFGFNGHAVIIKDMTKEKAAESDLMRNEIRYRTALDNIPSPVWMKDDLGRYVAINMAYSKLHGGEGSIIGKTDSEIFGEKIANDFAKSDEIAIKSGLTYRESTEYSSKLGKGYSLISKTPIFDSKGNFMGIAGISVDVTDYVKETLEGRKLNKIIHAIIEGTELFTVILGLDDDLLYISKTARNILGSNFELSKFSKLPMYNGKEIITENIYDEDEKLIARILKLK